MSELPDAAPARVIVCGTDFSDAARAAADTAAVLAAAMKARLRIVHVLDPGPIGWLGSREQRAVRDAVATALDAEAGRLEMLSTLAVERAVLDGSPPRVLAEEAARAVLVVLAASSRQGSRLRIGGTAERVAQLVAVPLLLIRDPAPLRRWFAGEQLAVAALLADDAASERIVGWLHVLQGIGSCDVAAIHGYYVDEATQRYGLVPRPLTRADHDIESYVARDIRSRLVARYAPDASVHPVLAVGRMADHLLAYPATAEAGLVVVGNHRACGVARLSSVAAGVVAGGRTAVLLVPSDSPPVGATSTWPSVRRVVVATDFSSFADEAIAHGYGLVADRGGQVVLVHVISSAAVDAGRSECLARLRALTPTPAPPGVTTEVEALWQEDEATGIAVVADRVAADVVVIASHGRSGVRRAVLGSVAQQVVQRSTRPVLVVRPPRDA